MAEISGTDLTGAIRLMFKNVESEEMVYIAFSRKNFYVLNFAMAMSVIANVVLVDLLINAPVVVQRINMSVFIARLMLPLSTIAAGLWLFLKEVNIVTGK